MMEKTMVLLKKYKYALLVLIVGILLMNLPTGRQKEPRLEPAPPAEPTFCQELDQLLSHIEGVGRAEVLLSVGQGPITYYQENREETKGENTDSIRSEIVTVTDTQRNESGLIRQINPEVYRGATVICQGADSPAIRLMVMEAVSKVTGLSSDRICVLKMN